MYSTNTLTINDMKDSITNWNVVDCNNYPKPDRKKIYCVHSKDRFFVAKVINHPDDEDLCQWKCTEFPHHRYDMCEGDSYIVLNQPIEDINDALELIFAYSLIPYKDGNQWCVLLGKNIQEGICGFGNTRLDAIMNFCKEYKSYPYSIAEFLISNGYV